MNTLKLATLNVRGLRGDRRHAVYSWVVSNKIQICLLQETYYTKDILGTVNKNWKGKAFHSLSDSHHSRGVSILFSDDFSCNVVSTHNDDNGRVLLVNFEHENIDYSVCNVYCPNEINKRVKFLGELEIFLANNAVSNQIFIGGDFNCIASKQDRMSNTLDKSSIAFSHLKTVYNSIDVWRHFHEDKVEFSYIDPSSRRNHSRIDYWLVSTEMIKSISCCHMTQAPTPDHKAVVIEYKFCDKKRGPGYWKLNNSILNDKDYREGIHQLFSETMNQYENIVSKQIIWEYLKVKIKELTVKYCTNISKQHVIQKSFETVICLRMWSTRQLGWMIRRCPRSVLGGVLG